jgi:hypothetical protein
MEVLSHTQIALSPTLIMSMEVLSRMLTMAQQEGGIRGVRLTPKMAGAAHLASYYTYLGRISLLSRSNIFGSLAKKKNLDLRFKEEQVRLGQQMGKMESSRVYLTGMC